MGRQVTRPEPRGKESPQHLPTDWVCMLRTGGIKGTPAVVIRVTGWGVVLVWVIENIGGLTLGRSLSLSMPAFINNKVGLENPT